MNRSRAAGRPARPWHVWLVAAVMFALYVGGARDYLLILVGDTDYVRGQFGDSGVVYFSDYPVALRVLWTVNILGGLLAPVLLVLRRRSAFAVAVIAAAAQLVHLAVTFGFRNRWAMLGTANSWFDLGVGAAAVLFAVYCWAVQRRGGSRTEAAASRSDRDG